MKIKASLLATDIKNGQHQSNDKCPYGLALKRTFPNCKISAEWNNKNSNACLIRVRNKTTLLEFNLPSNLAEELYKWEYKGGNLSPRTFEIDL